MTKKLIAILLVVLLACLLMAFVVGGRAPTRPEGTQPGAAIVQDGQSVNPGSGAPPRMPRWKPRVLPTAPDEFPYPIVTEEAYP
jgi:hypothetical protein